MPDSETLGGALHLSLSIILQDDHDRSLKSVASCDQEEENRRIHLPIAFVKLFSSVDIIHIPPTFSFITNTGIYKNGLGFV